MKTFEENCAAWLEGRLTGDELTKFEASLPEISAAQLETQDAQNLSAFLREQLSAPAMTNEEFFHHQLSRQIESESRATTRVPAVEAPARETWWSISRLLWTGATCLMIFGVSTFALLHDKPTSSQSSYLTQVMNARIDPVVSPDATISVFEAKEDRVTVLWIDGLQSLPSEFAAK